MRTAEILFLVSVSCGALACGGTPDSSPETPAPHVAYDGTPLLAGFSPPGPPKDALQLVSPIIHDVPPGGNTEYCYYTKQVLKEATAFKAGQGYQAAGGHHVVAYWAKTPQPEGMHECTEADMASLHVLSGDGGEAGNGIINGLPAGGAFHVPAGAQIVLNVHALNASSKTVDTQAVVNLYYGDPSLVPLSSFYVTGTAMHVEPHATATYTASCDAPIDLSAARILGHMHEWGTRSQIIIDDGTGPKSFYDKPGSDEFSFNPPFIDYPVDSPLLIKKGSKITTVCTYNNTTAKPLDFPTEMCAAFGYVIGTGAELGCADGQWNQ